MVCLLHFEAIMLDHAVKYLRSQGVTFRLFSYSAPEPHPSVAHPLRTHEGAHMVDTHVVLIDGVPGIACTLRDHQVNYASLGNYLNASVFDGSIRDLPPPFNHASPPAPPLGKLMNVPIFVDEELLASAVIAFYAFSPCDVIEILYEDFSRIEQPRTAKFAFAGELPPEQEEEEAAPWGRAAPPLQRRAG